jgi:hypothetical protein
MAAKKDQRKGDRPETVRQAQTWETVKGHYVAAGLDDGCAGQAAYGHQMGFSRVKDPCVTCRTITLPNSLIERHGDRGQRWLDGAFTGVRVVVIDE